jgi:hypothetical protein
MASATEDAERMSRHPRGALKVADRSQVVPQRCLAEAVDNIAAAVSCSASTGVKSVQKGAAAKIVATKRPQHDGHGRLEIIPVSPKADRRAIAPCPFAQPSYHVLLAAARRRKVCTSRFSMQDQRCG